MNEQPKQFYGNYSVNINGLKQFYLHNQRDTDQQHQQQQQQYFNNNNCNNWRTKDLIISSSIPVKKLCKSFQDLTHIHNSENNLLGLIDTSNKNNLKRFKSVGELTKHLTVTTIHTFGVSVRALRDSYCNLVGLSRSLICNNDTNTSLTNYNKKSSFSKFDALQKKNVSKEKIIQDNIEPVCHTCSKIVYKMEEIKAENNVWHRNCFKCSECNKQLKVDNFQRHEDTLYCIAHFKLLFAPKIIDDEPVKPKKPELIIRENQPVELPPDVARASDKTDLGLEELQQLNVKSRFEMFEKYQENQQQKQQLKQKNELNVKRSQSILTKLAKFKAKGMITGVKDEELNCGEYELSDNDDNDDANSYDDNDDDDDDDEKLLKSGEGDDPDLIRAKRAQRERPIRFNQMNDIKTKFENGHIMSKEERREERKQEIQNIRSRLFAGKQARIKEQYQQAVAESEQSNKSSKPADIEISDKARSLKERFEKGEIYREYDENSSHIQDNEMSVFESGIGKQSRSLFMELDAKSLQSPKSDPTSPIVRSISTLADDKLKPFCNSENIIRCDEKPDDIKIETSEVLSKFKFFEQYQPKENFKRKEFRITPPRDGVVHMPDNDDNNNNHNNADEKENDENALLAKSNTTTKMLSLFRDMETSKRWHDGGGLKPLKRFTPPPDDNRRIYTNDSDEEYDGEEEDEMEGEEEMDDVEDYDNDGNHLSRYNDEYLIAAKKAERATQLRAKFEKWEANEIKREISNGTINVYDNCEDSQIESAKSLKAKFESMKNQTSPVPRAKIQVNRFV